VASDHDQAFPRFFFSAAKPISWLVGFDQIATAASRLNASNPNAGGADIA